MPSPVDRYFDQVKKDNPSYSDEQAWATAWSIYCKHKNPGSEHCHQDEYLTGKSAHRVASRYFDERYARLLWAMSLGEAKAILGFPPTSSPTPEEVAKAYKRKAIEVHPDRGGSHEKMVEVNVAKDVLDKARSGPAPKDYSWSGPGPYKQDPRPPRWQDDPQTVYMKGQDFDKAWSSSGVPANVEWKFVSIPEWYWEKTYYPGHRIYVLYGQTDQKHIFLAIKERGESSGVIPTDMGPKTHVEEDWQTSMVDVPLSQNIAKIAPKYLKSIGTSWADGASPKPPRKFIAWPGGKPTPQALKKIPRSGGAGLKEILVGTGLLNDEDPSVVGRKSVVEIYTSRRKTRAHRDPSNMRSSPGSDAYDFFVRVNGKTEQLTDDTIVNMNKKFIPWIMNYKFDEGVPFNVSRLRGSRMKFPASVALRELADCMTGEPSWVVIALERAAEEYEGESKTAQLVNLRSEMTLHQAAEVLGMSAYDLFQRMTIGDQPSMSERVANRFKEALGLAEPIEQAAKAAKKVEDLLLWMIDAARKHDDENWITSVGEQLPRILGMYKHNVMLMAEAIDTIPKGKEQQRAKAIVKELGKVFSKSFEYKWEGSRWISPSKTEAALKKLVPLADELEKLLAGQRVLFKGASVVQRVAERFLAAKARTFDDARKDIFDLLKKEGWKVVDGLKIPHATSPNGKLRLWFKRQAVYFTEGNNHTFGGARTITYDLDIRKMTAEQFMSSLKKWFPESL